MRKTAGTILGIALVGGITFAVLRARGRDAADASAKRGDVAPAGVAEQEELVDTAIDGSFPASDPPSYWGRAAAD